MQCHPSSGYSLELDGRDPAPEWDGAWVQQQRGKGALEKGGKA